MTKKDKQKRRSLLFDKNDCPKFFAGYDHYSTVIAVFDSETDRDKWINADSFFTRIALCLVDAVDIVGMFPDHEFDHDNILWLLNPINL